VSNIIKRYKLFLENTKELNESDILKYFKLSDDNIKDIFIDFVVNDYDIEIKRLTVPEWSDTETDIIYPGELSLRYLITISAKRYTDIEEDLTFEFKNSLNLLKRNMDTISIKLYNTYGDINLDDIILKDGNMGHKEHTYSKDVHIDVVIDEVNISLKQALDFIGINYEYDVDRKLPYVVYKLEDITYHIVKNDVDYLYDNEKLNDIVDNIFLYSDLDYKYSLTNETVIKILNKFIEDDKLKFPYKIDGKVYDDYDDLKNDIDHYSNGNIDKIIEDISIELHDFIRDNYRDELYNNIDEQIIDNTIDDFEYNFIHKISNINHIEKFRKEGEFYYKLYFNYGIFSDVLDPHYSWDKKEANKYFEDYYDLVYAFLGDHNMFEISYGDIDTTTLSSESDKSINNNILEQLNNISY
jgi:hypothetical protein